MAGQLIHFQNATGGHSDRTRTPGIIISLPVERLVAHEERLFDRVASMQVVGWLTPKVFVRDRVVDRPLHVDQLFRTFLYLRTFGRWKRGSITQISLANDGVIATLGNTEVVDEQWFTCLPFNHIVIESNGIRAVFHEHGRVHLAP